tara:strand:- start:4228 stop:5361 length:1134 start_codon:yes stop_codon:yes gene_type:complete
MFNISFPAKHSWNPLSKELQDAVGFVAGSHFSPFIKAHIYTPASGVTASYQPASLPSAVAHVAARKQGRWIACVAGGYLSVYAFSTSTGFGSRSSHVAITGVSYCCFSHDGSMLLVGTSSGYQIYDFNHGTGLGSLLTTAASSVTGTIKNIAVSPDSDHFIVSGTGGSMIERRSFNDLLGAGLTCATTPPAAGVTYSSSGYNIAGNGICKLSGVCANGKSYYAYTSSRYCYYGLVNANGLGDPSVIDMAYVMRGVDFIPEYNLIAVGAATDPEGRSQGADLRLFALSDTPTDLSRSNNVSNYSCTGNGGSAGSDSNPGGAPWSIKWISSMSSLVVGLGYGWNNTRPFHSIGVASNGALTSQSYPTNQPKGVESIDWF